MRLRFGLEARRMSLLLPALASLIPILSIWELYVKDVCHCATFTKIFCQGFDYKMQMGLPGVAGSELTISSDMYWEKTSTQTNTNTESTSVRIIVPKFVLESEPTDNISSAKPRGRPTPLSCPTVLHAAMPGHLRERLLMSSGLEMYVQYPDLSLSSSFANELSIVYHRLRGWHNLELEIRG
jgi:hypothetical protein